MRDRLISGIQNDRIRKKLLSKKDLSLTKYIQLLKSTEAIQLQARDMAMLETSAVQEITTHSFKQQRGRLPTGNSSRPQKPCRYCGRKHDFKKDTCPAAEKKCYNCNKKGHFGKQCRSSKAQHIEDDYSDEEEVFFIHAVKSIASQPWLRVHE